MYYISQYRTKKLPGLQIRKIRQQPKAQESRIKRKESSTNQPKQMMKFIEENNRLMSKLREEVVSLRREIQSQRDDPLGDSLPKFPLESREEFLKLEEEIENNDTIKKEMVTFFYRQGGNDEKKFLKRCLKTIITDDVAKGYCWLGTKEKTGIRGFTSISVLRMAYMQRFPEGDDRFFESVVKRHFQYANDRINKKARYTPMATTT